MYAASGFLKTDIIKRLLMHGIAETPSLQKDIPRGAIFGVRRVPGGGSGYQTGWVEVGIDSIKGTPEFD